MVSRPRHGLSLCAGGGGLDMGLMLAEPGFHTRCFVEWEEYPRRSIVAAQRAGYFGPAPIWDDLTKFDARPFAGAFDTLLAGYPCQPFSQAGQRLGEDDERHLWPDVARVARELGPGLEWIFLENVAGHVTLGLETVLRELWEMGFTPAAGLFTAAETGASHERERVFIVAHRDTDANERRMVAGRSGRSSRKGQSEGGERERLRSRAWSGCGDLDDAEGVNRGIHSGSRREGAGTPDAGRSEPSMGHPTGIGCGEGRAEPELRIGRDAASGAGGTLADASSPERQGQQRGQHHAGGWQVKDGHPPLLRGTGLFPPGPSAASAWADTLAVAPDLAPAAGLADCLAWARDMAASLEGAEQAAAESALRRMADGLALRTRALRLLGNGVFPLAAAHAWRTLAVAHGLWPVDLGAVSESGSADANEFVRVME